MVHRCGTTIIVVVMVDIVSFENSLQMNKLEVNIR